MTVQECYEKLEGDYGEACGRLVKDELIKKFAIKFLDDRSFGELSEALESGETQNAFRAAHTLKGVSANLSFSKLYKSSCEITEMLRSENLEEAKQYYPTVQADYDLTVSAIKNLL